MIANASLVLQVEVGRQIANGEFGSAPGHPFWMSYAAKMISEARVGNTSPIYATGPVAMIDVFKKMFPSLPSIPAGDLVDPWGELHAHATKHLASVNVSVDRDSIPTPGNAAAPQRLTTRLFPTGLWLEPCHWAKPTCMEANARAKPLLGTRRDFMGEHHTSASWHKTEVKTGRPSHLARIATPASTQWFATASEFLALRGCGCSGFCTSSSADAAGANCIAAGGAWRQAGAHQWCEEAAANNTRGCTTLAVVQHLRDYTTKQAVAGLLQLPCQLTVVSGRGVSGEERNSILALAKSTSGAAGAASQVSWHHMALDWFDDYLAQPPTASLDLATKLATEGGARELRAALVDVGEFGWRVLAAEYAARGATLQAAGALLLVLPAPPAQAPHFSYYAFQHLVQMLGFVGVSHAAVTNSTWPVAVALQQLAVSAPS